MWGRNAVGRRELMLWWVIVGDGCMLGRRMDLSVLFFQLRDIEIDGY